MTSKVRIVNFALTLLAAARISAVSEARGQDVDAVYDETVDAVLRSHPWNFAIRRAQLPADADAPAFGFNFQYTWPEDPYCLRVLEVDEDPAAAFEPEGRKILTDVGAPLNVRYIARITDPNQFDADFVIALATDLAANTAFKITGSTTLRDQLKSDFAAQKREAESVDAQEGPAAEGLAEEDDAFNNSRI